MTTTSLALAAAMRWKRATWHADGTITLGETASEAGRRGLWVGEGKGVAVILWNGRFQYGAPVGRGKGEEFRDALVLLANPELRKRYLGEKGQ